MEILGNVQDDGVDLKGLRLEKLSREGLETFKNDEVRKVKSQRGSMLLGKM